MLERGVYDRAGTLLIPPRLYDVAAARRSIQRLHALKPEVVLTAHFDVMEGAEALAFLDRSEAHIDTIEEATQRGIAGGIRGLWPLTQHVDAELGPYPEFTIELAASVRWFAERIETASVELRTAEQRSSTSGSAGELGVGRTARIRRDPSR